MRIKSGAVYLVGAGPGDPDLITLKGMRLLRQADVILYDRLVSRELLACARPDAEWIDVGKAPGKHRYAQGWINAMLINRARAGLSIVRLKGGDPFVFGRGYEELAACREAGVECHVVPGVSSAIAGPAAAGIPVTRRGTVRSCVVITGQVAVDEPAPSLDYAALTRMDTIVVLMGRANLGELTQSLVAAGKPADTPAACVENATSPNQRVLVATLGSLSTAVEQADLSAPVVTIIGPTAALASAGQAESPGLDARVRALLSQVV